ncbi:hypothetical protein PoB_003402700 [Plakobranchus ocellatus]|uniref:Uncharacterized protein n=1 Tax=Plakobranchus ocellatus TaxID=259542 RepID=A0AAV4AJU5_9GAST|nr:hypothetical protein PoB_003402700 [Plakobranchus ocellatus]
MSDTYTFEMNHRKDRRQTLRDSRRITLIKSLKSRAWVRVVATRLSENRYTVSVRESGGTCSPVCFTRAPKEEEVRCDVCQSPLSPSLTLFIFFLRLYANGGVVLCQRVL